MLASSARRPEGSTEEGERDSERERGIDSKCLGERGETVCAWLTKGKGIWEGTDLEEG